MPCSDFEAYRSPVPGAGVFDSPCIALSLNTEWASFVDGLLSQLLNPCIWAGTETEIEAAQQEVYKLLVRLGQVGDCPVTTIPVGAVIAFAGGDVPSGFLLCDGAHISRSAYAALFAAIGEVYGAGDGSTTFTLPDLRSRAPIGAGQGPALSRRNLGTPIGAETHLLTASEMPSHDHTRNVSGVNETVFRPGVSGTASTGSGSAALLTNQSRTGSTGGGFAHNNMQPSLALNFIIYAGG